MSTKSLQLEVTLGALSISKKGNLSVVLQPGGYSTAQIHGLLELKEAEQVLVHLTTDRKTAATWSRSETNEKGQTPSQELRLIIWQKWAAQPAVQTTTEPFESYYQRQMRRIIDSAAKNL